MLHNIEINCPYCTQSTVVAVASPDRTGRYQKKVSYTHCRKCGRPIITVTSEDGSVAVQRVPQDQGTSTAPPPQKTHFRKGRAEDRIDIRSRPSPPIARASTSHPSTNTDQLPASHAIEVDKDGHDEDEMIIPMNRVLWRKDGTRRSHEEAVKLVGNRAVWVAELSEALERRLAGPRPLSIPARIFVSYRWGQPEDDAWVERLVNNIQHRGYDVTFDKTHSHKDTSVPEFVSRIGDCTLFLAVIDPGYVKRLGTGQENESIEDGWVFDEYNNAVALSNAGHLQIVGFLRKGDILPRGFKLPTSGKLGNVADVRDPGKLEASINQLFPVISNLPKEEAIENASELLRQSHFAASEGCLDDAFNLALAAAETIPNIVDGHAECARLAVRSNHAKEGLAAVSKALAIDPYNLEMLTLAASCSYHLQERHNAIRFCKDILDLAEDDQARKHTLAAHYYLGNALDDLGQVYAGIAHLEIARRLSPQDPNCHNDTGLAYRHIDELSKAVSCFLRGLELSPTDINLLVNLAAAFLEAGNTTASKTTLERIKCLQPDHPSLMHLGEILRRVHPNTTEFPKLVPRAPKRNAVGTIRCTECACEIPMLTDDELLCAGCGAERFEKSGACKYCGADGFSFPTLGFFLCPYCRNGTVHVELNAS